MDSRSDAEVAVAAAEVGAAVIRERFGGQLERYAKVGTDFATEADLESERAIMAVIQGARPDDAVVGEEYGASGESDRTWLVDPLCGTLNFAAQNPLFSVNVALRSPGGDVAAVAQPLTGEIFWTDGTAVFIRHDGADRPAVPSAASRLVDIDIDAPATGPFLGAQLLTDEKLRAAFALRVSSTTLALAWVAVGRQAAYIADNVSPTSVHFTAGTILCQAAQIPVTDFRGNPVHTTPGLLATASPDINTSLLDFLAPHLT
ncbi:inositol monophosphatase family protein [Kribbella sp. NBC_00709]|uniref:inositol monophosphatase family protein n=1 Tax=Kribbella sp. NBC_00709 TaxID=2975972 RepID=UPI002E2CD928|nr:inositol monophosphatase family protein [Kribbella sp. NBC_00709]